MVFCLKQKTAYESRISDWSSDVCSSDLIALHQRTEGARQLGADLAEPGLDISDDFGAALIIVGKFIFGVLGERVHPVADRTLRITQLLEDREIGRAHV